MSSLEISFAAQCRYTIAPYRWTYRLSLGLVESWRNLDDIARFALKRVGYGNTDSGFGLEYPTREDRKGMVRFWRWDWRRPGRIRTRKYHFPEADYLATLAARLRVVGKDELAGPIARMMPLPDVELLPRPDPYDISNYRLHNPRQLSYELGHCQRFILDQRDFALARQRLHDRAPFILPDGSRLEHGEDGRMVLHTQRGHTQETTVVFYLSVLDATERAYRAWASRDASRHDPAPG